MGNSYFFIPLGSYMISENAVAKLSYSKLPLRVQRLVRKLTEGFSKTYLFQDPQLCQDIVFENLLFLLTEKLLCMLNKC